MVSPTRTAAKKEAKLRRKELLATAHHIDDMPKSTLKKIVRYLDEYATLIGLGNFKIDQVALDQVDIMIGYKHVEIAIDLETEGEITLGIIPVLYIKYILSDPINNRERDFGGDMPNIQEPDEDDLNMIARENLLQSNTICF